MKFPICHQPTCEAEAQYYLMDKKVYVCAVDRDTQYSKEHSLKLVQPESVKILLRVINQCRKELVLDQEIRDKNRLMLSPQEESKGFEMAIKEQSEDVLSRLKEAVECKEYYKFRLLLKEARQIEDMITNDPIFIKHAINTTWKNSMSIARGEEDQSIAFIKKEAEQRYAALVVKTSKTIEAERKESYLKRKALKQKHENDMKNDKKTLYSSIFFLIGILVMYLFFSNFEIKYSDQCLSFRYLKGVSYSKFNNLRLKYSKARSMILDLNNELDLQRILLDNSTSLLNTTVNSEEAIISNPLPEFDHSLCDILKTTNTSSSPNQSTSSTIKTITFEDLKTLSYKTPQTISINTTQNTLSFHLNSTRYYVSFTDKDDKTFLKNYFPGEVQELNLYGFEDYFFYQQINEFKQIAPKVKKKISIFCYLENNFKLQKVDFEILIPHLLHVETIEFSNCQMDLPSTLYLDYGVLKSSIKTLHFDNIDQSFFKQGMIRSSKFQKLIESFSKIKNFKENLETIKITNLKFFEEDIHNALNRSKLKDVRIDRGRIDRD
ncbi:unnamed protein product [Moneuplotes crassus]|uniref:Transmembrane protein n=1 Tax=Euplotes crassus TaxID=5936 RepID=A0AAD1U587_EUPCR|nr:unnamed protein product [Moneuplotes crassus]